MAHLIAGYAPGHWYDRRNPEREEEYYEVCIDVDDNGAAALASPQCENIWGHLKREVASVDTLNEQKRLWWPRQAPTTISNPRTPSC